MTTTQGILVACMICFFVRDMFEVLVFEQYSLIANAFYWINFALLFVLLICTLKDKEWLLLSNFLLLNVFTSLIIASYQFATNFPVRAPGLSGTENHLAMQIVHVFFISTVLGVSKAPLYLLRLLGLVTLSRAYIACIILTILFDATKKIWRALYFSFFLVIICVFGVALGLGDFLSDVGIGGFIEQRFSITSNPSDRDGRGYLRMINDPEYFIYGASEVVRLFNGDPFFGQIHSNFLSLAFCFGVIGALFSVVYIRQLFIRGGFFLGGVYLMYSMSLYFYSNAIFLLFTAFLFRGGLKSMPYMDGYPGIHTRSKLTHKQDQG